MARALDSRKEEIDQIARTLPPSKYYVSVKMGPITVREAKPELMALAKLGGQKDTPAWSRIYNDYQAIKNSETNLSWLRLKGEVLGILVDDRQRVLTNWNPYLDKDSETSLLSFQRKIEDCLSIQTCEAISFDPATSYFVQTQPYYREYINEISAVTTSADKRAWIKKLSERVKNDMNYTFGFVKSAYVSFDGQSKFHLEIDPGPFSEALDALRSYIETVWHSDEYSLLVNWQVRTNEQTGLFAFVQEPGNGGRSFVHYKDHTVHLFDGERASSIAHEIGHVLGFPDAYFTVWQPATCEYKVQFTDEDLMSESAYKKVNPSHWEKLKSVYKR